MTFTTRYRSTLIRLGKILAFTATILGTTKLAPEFAALSSASTSAFSFLIIVLLSAYFGDLLVAITTSCVATLCFDYFYLPPMGTFHISAFSDWISLAAFLLASVIISRLTASAAENSKRVALLDKTLAQLKEFEEWLLSTPNGPLKLSVIAQEALRIFSLEYCSIHVYGEEKWRHFTGVASSEISQKIETRLNSIQDNSRDLMDLVDENMLGVRYMQISNGKTPLTALVVKSETLPTDAMKIMAGMVGVKLNMVGEITS